MARCQWTSWTHSLSLSAKFSTCAKSSPSIAAASPGTGCEAVVPSRSFPDRRSFEGPPPVRAIRGGALARSPPVSQRDLEVLEDGARPERGRSFAEDRAMLCDEKRDLAQERADRLAIPEEPVARAQQREGCDEQRR